MTSPEKTATRTSRPPQPSTARAEQQGLVDELRALPPKQRAAIVLRYFEGLEFGEIASVLGTGENAVRSNISRGLARLRIQMTEALAQEVVR